MVHDLRWSRATLSHRRAFPVGRGWIKDLDATVASFFPEDAGLALAEEGSAHAAAFAAMFIDDVGEVGSGMRTRFIPTRRAANNETQMCKAPNPYRYVLEGPVDRLLGEVFNYVTGAPTLPGAVLYKPTGNPSDALERELRFDPLGISDVAWTHFGKRDPMGGGGLRMRPRDLAQIGRLVPLHSQWDDRQIVPPGTDRTVDGAAAQRLFGVRLPLVSGGLADP